MIRDHRPYWLKKAYRRLEHIYTRRFLAPQFEHLGAGYVFARPWHVEIFGWPISIGRNVNVIATPDRKVRLSIWGEPPGAGRILIGDCCLICPGVRIGAAREIRIGDNVMLAADVYVMDSDWHDLYNRISPCRNVKPVTIADNAWIGDSAIVCKGVTVGENSVVGAGSVVVDDVPPNSIAVGNPARVVRTLDPDRTLTTRSDWYARHPHFARDMDVLDRASLKQNTLAHWLRHLLFPARGE